MLKKIRNKSVVIFAVISSTIVSPTIFASITNTDVVDALLQQAELNNPRAQYQVAQAYKTGDGVTQSSQEAIYWLKQAATNRYKPAQRELIDNYLHAGQTKSNQEQAFYWLTKLAISGDDQAQFELGQLYEQEAEQVDTLGQAKLWYQIAAEHNPQAETALSRILEQEFNDQRAKQLADISQLDEQYNSSLTNANQTTVSVIGNLLNPLSILLLSALSTLIMILLWLWRSKKSFLRRHHEQSEKTLSHSETLKQQIQQKDRALHKQNQQLERLYNQLKKQQAALKVAPTKATNKTSHLELACAMLGFSADRLPDEKQIKQRYKQLCKIYHPDLKGSEEEMKRLNTCIKLVLCHVNK